MPNYLTTKNEEIVRLKKEIARLKMKPDMQAFWHQVGENITLLMATSPRSSWPRLCQISFDRAARSAATIAEAVKQELPTEERKL